VGLTNVLTYLYEEYYMAYREVKPSNVLLYKNIDNILITKITDFGIAADLEAAVVWQPGTIRAKST
jgi:serine/threonine protein kinase